MQRLEGKRAVITGGAKGLGRATAELFAEHGAAVMIADMDEQAAKDCVAAIEGKGGKALYRIVDVRDEDAVASLFSDTAEAFGGVDILVNAAGVVDSGVIAHEVPLDEWRRVVDIDLTGSFICSKTAVPYMLGNNGSIVNIASTAGLSSVCDGNAPYHAAKGGVVMMTKNFAISYAKKGIRCNCVCPGTTLTDLVRKDLINKFGSVEAGEPVYGAMHPMGRLGRPIETAYAILYLASDEASWTTGVALPVDGGFTAA